MSLAKPAVNVAGFIKWQIYLTSSKNTKAKARHYIHDIWTAEAREKAKKRFNLFIKTYELKYPKFT
jgi:hypothetical protein